MSREVKIIHLGDTHIKNLKYHNEYREVFSTIYSILIRENPYAILHCGDLAHSKTNISNEYFVLASEFLKNLANIAPTYIIPGNHDLLVKNIDRLDSITPIVSALKHPNLHYLKYSCEIDIGNDIVLNHLSLIDKENWILSPTDKGKINIALYHGAIVGSMTDTGWIVEHGDIEPQRLKEFDYAFLGDIHKKNQILDRHGKCRYVGSTIQQNFGEEDDKGFLIWKIYNKDKYGVEPVTIFNPKPFITIKLTEEGKIPFNLKEIKKDSRIRLLCDKELSYGAVKDVVALIKNKFHTKDVFYHSNKISKRKLDIDKLYKQENLRDEEVQKRLIKRFLSSFHITNDVLKKVYELNEKYNSSIQKNEDVVRNVYWKIKEVKWDNLFNYGENNKINYSDMKGIIGIFGKSHSGKTSIIDQMLYTIFNSISKNSRKNVDIINQNEEVGFGYAVIEIDNKEFIIERTSEKYDRKLKGELSVEAKTDVIFKKRDENGYEEILNGENRNETDKNIRKMLGTIEDFLLTSMSSQFGSLQFIDEGSTKRKEILAKFLDLDIFEQKYRLAKEEISGLKNEIKKYEQEKYDELIKQQNLLSEDNQKQIKENNNYLKELKRNIELIKERSVNIIIEEELGIFDITEQIRKKEILEEKIRSFEKEIETLNDELSLNINSQILNECTIKFVDIDNEKKKLSEIKNLEEKSKVIKYDFEKINSKIKNEQKKTKLLDEIPCKNKFPNCKFIRDANEALENIPHMLKEIDFINDKIKKIEQSIIRLEPELVRKNIKRYNKDIEYKAKYERDITKVKLNIEIKKNEKREREIELEEVLNKINVYNINKEAVEKYNKELEKRELEKKEIKQKEKELFNLEDKLKTLYQNQGSIEQKIIDLKERKNKLECMKREYESYELFLKCMHFDGISYSIIKKQLPIINNEMNKILSPIVDFDIFFEANGKRLDVFIKHPKYGPRTISLASGAEKALAAIAIRLALLKVSTLPCSQILILDEPATMLDSDLMEGFIKILEIAKNSFDTIILISHLDALKEIVNKNIVIEKDGKGYAHISM